MECRQTIQGVAEKAQNLVINEEYEIALELLRSVYNPTISDSLWDTLTAICLLETGDQLSAKIILQGLIAKSDLTNIENDLDLLSLLIRSGGEIDAGIFLKNNFTKLISLKLAIKDLTTLAAIFSVLGEHLLALNYFEAVVDNYDESEKSEFFRLFSRVHRHLDDLAGETDKLALSLEHDPTNSNTHAEAASLFARFDESEAALEHSAKAEETAKDGFRPTIALDYFQACKSGSFALQEELKEKWLNHPDADQLSRAPFAALVATDDPEFIFFQNQLFSESVTLKRKTTRQSSFTSSKPNSSKIRVGYFSPDFRNHAVGHLITDLIGSHDREKFEIIGISIAHQSSDQYRRNFETLFDSFYACEDMSTPELSRLANSLCLDFAIDLAGYTKGFRPLLFERITYCIKINYLGYPSTMGYNGIDYIIGDPIVTPDGHEQFFTEKIIRLKRSYQCNSPSRQVIEVSRKEAGLPDDCFVFCNFNSRQKLNKETLTAWKAILEKTPDAFLWMLDPGGKMRQEYNNCFGNNATQIIYADQKPPYEHLGRIRHANLFLDSFPYGAHTTASDAIFSGVPVLPIAGRSFQSRVALSLNYFSGTDLKSYSWPEFIENAIDFYNSYSYEKKAAYVDLLRDFKNPTHPYNIEEFRLEFEAVLESLMR